VKISPGENSHIQKVNSHINSVNTQSFSLPYGQHPLSVLAYSAKTSMHESEDALGLILFLAF
jgi:hypothetical protein